MVRDWSRRKLISRLGAVAALGALAGCPDTDGGPSTDGPPFEPPPGVRSPEQERPVVEDYDTVIDVAEAGADPEGSDSIVPTLEEIDGPSVLLQFPPGEYYMEDTWIAQGFDRLGIHGPDATITTIQEFTGPLFGLGNNGGVGNLFVGGLTFDFTGADTGPRPIDARANNSLYLSDVTVNGEFDIDQDGMRIEVNSETGSGLVRNLRLPDGGNPEYSNTGCYVGETHRGTLVFQNCRINGFPDNGLYASSAAGRVNVVGGRYFNSGVSNVRVSGPAAIRGVLVRCNEARDGIENMRGIRLRAGDDIVLENSRIIMDTVTSSDGAITCAEWLESATIRDNHVTVNTDDVPAFLAKPPVDGMDTQRSHPIQLRNLSVDGSADRGAAVRILDRSGALLHGLCICQPGENRDGISLSDTSETTVRASNITVTGTPLATDGASVVRNNLSLQSTDTAGSSSCNCSGTS